MKDQPSPTVSWQRIALSIVINCLRIDIDDLRDTKQHTITRYTRARSLRCKFYFKRSPLGSLWLFLSRHILGLTSEDRDTIETKLDTIRKDFENRKIPFIFYWFRSLKNVLDILFGTGRKLFLSSFLIGLFLSCGVLISLSAEHELLSYESYNDYKKTQILTNKKLYHYSLNNEKWEEAFKTYENCYYGPHGDYCTFHYKKNDHQSIYIRENYPKFKKQIEETVKEKTEAGEKSFFLFYLFNGTLYDPRSTTEIVAITIGLSVFNSIFFTLSMLVVLLGLKSVLKRHEVEEIHAEAWLLALLTTSFLAIISILSLLCYSKFFMGNIHFSWTTPLGSVLILVGFLLVFHNPLFSVPPFLIGWTLIDLHVTRLPIGNMAAYPLVLSAVVSFPLVLGMVSFFLAILGKYSLELIRGFIWYSISALVEAGTRNWFAIIIVISAILSAIASK